MQIGLVADSLADLSLAEALDWITAQGIEAVEIGTGGFSTAPHCKVDRLLDDARARAEFKDAIERRGLQLSALNCNGNVLDPDPERGKRHKGAFFQTIQLASQIGLDTVVAMSGCPGGPDGGSYPNFVTYPWQREFVELLKWQWDEVIEPFWKQAGQFAADHGVRVAIEMHPGQAVYNVRTLQRLRAVAGPAVGANFDPSHMFFQGMDPLLMLRALGEGFVFHVHAKDARLNPQEMALNGALETRPVTMVAERSWNYRTLGFGHGSEWWRDFASTLRVVGYDGVLSIEHEDALMSAREGIAKSVEFLRPIVLRTMPEEKLPWL